LWGHHRNFANHYRWPEKIKRLLSATPITRADGTYRVTGLLPQRYGVHLVGFPYGNRAPAGWLPPARVERYRGVTAVAKQTRQAPDIVLRRSALIRIRTLDRDTVVPVEGVRWVGFNEDETKGALTAMSVDAHRGRRRMKDYRFTAVTDKNGTCTLSLD
ncbi:hypothetical protein NQ036_15445, partial [Brevibacterium sp. 91QC2O2]|uniref:hypothetical protein n=1 Tax=Brevibacterium sp. 91QC2O2 TaxID=2968458 RepID=UPI00211CC232